jgi:hypothetical protein
MLAVGRRIRVWVVAGVVTALSSCINLAPHDEEAGFCSLSFALSPSCEVSDWTAFGLGVSSGCAACLLASVPGLATRGDPSGGYCCAFWACFCDCPLEDTGCYQGCESTIDAECARDWVQIWYEAQHVCHVGMGDMERLGCEECMGQPFAVSLTELAHVEARLGGAQMFAPVPCENEDGGSISLVQYSGQDSFSRDSRAEGAGTDAPADGILTEFGDSAQTDANRDATLVDGAGDSP